MDPMPMTYSMRGVTASKKTVAWTERAHPSPASGWHHQWRVARNVYRVHHRRPRSCDRKIDRRSKSGGGERSPGARDPAPPAGSLRSRTAARKAGGGGRQGSVPPPADWPTRGREPTPSRGSQELSDPTETLAVDAQTGPIAARPARRPLPRCGSRLWYVRPGQVASAAGRMSAVAGWGALERSRHGPREPLALVYPTTQYPLERVTVPSCEPWMPADHFVVAAGFDTAAGAFASWGSGRPQGMATRIWTYPSGAPARALTRMRSAGASSAASFVG